jgi:ferritin-like metal-binding protein YciE
MFEHFDTPEQIFSFKLGSALTMERDTLEMLGELEQSANHPEMKELFRGHAEETRQQIENIEKSFALLGESVSDAPSPTTKGLAKEAKASLAKTDSSIADAVILAGALETEHYEIAVYETLVTNAKARGANDVAALLQHNLDQEESAKEKVKAIAAKLSMEGYAVANA